ncbi:hypothetical protein GOP47_0027801 [Adiantum capillus-veneris]|nr:hypothetical protein GOP47_0027801 [Adiantum capillus-veneris]
MGILAGNDVGIDDSNVVHGCRVMHLPLDLDKLVSHTFVSGNQLLHAVAMDLRRAQQGFTGFTATLRLTILQWQVNDSNQSN